MSDAAMTVEDAWRSVLAVAHDGPDAVGDLVVGPDGSWTATFSVTAESRDLLDLYLPLAARAELIVGQVGQSLDGRVATEAGHSHYVTGPEDITRLHRVRALVDAVVVGAGTAVADRPRLTVRRVDGPNPTRVVLDPRGRVPAEGPLFEDGSARTLWIRRSPPEGRMATHVRWVESPRPGPDGVVSPSAVVALLRDRGLRRVLVEGGGETVSRFLAARALNRLHVTVAPLVIGSGRHGLTLPPVTHLKDALRPRVRHFVLGDDVLFDLELEAAGTSGATDGGSPDASPPNASR